jgi:hypothetical protein
MVNNTSKIYYLFLILLGTFTFMFIFGFIFKQKKEIQYVLPTDVNYNTKNNDFRKFQF